MKHFYLVLCLIVMILLINPGNLYADKNTPKTHLELEERVRKSGKVDKEETDMTITNPGVADVQNVSATTYQIGETRSFQTLGQMNPDNTIHSGDYQVSQANTSPDSSSHSKVAYAHKLLQEVKEMGNFIQELDSASVINLPVGITCGKGADYAIIIEKIHFKKGETYLEAYMAFTLPQNGEKIAFHSDHIPFSMERGLSGEMTMELVSSHQFSIGDGIKMRLKNEGETFIKWDCGGFSQMNIDAEIEFSPNLLVPENQDGSIKQGEKLTAEFTTSVSDWNNLLVELSLDPFQIKGVKGLGFEVTRAVFDFSDFANSGAMKFPENYLDDYNMTGNPNLWRGIYIQEANIKLPPEFKSENQPGRYTLFASDILIDDQGFSGSVGARNLFSMEEGRMDKWAYSIDDFTVTIRANQLTSAGFSGMMNIPAFKENSALEYSAIMNTGGEYIFNLSPAENMDFPLFAGEMNVYQTSSISVELDNHRFVPTAILNGKVNIQPNDVELSLADIEFQQLRLSSRKPYLSVGACSFGSETAQQAMQGFPLSIRQIGIEQVNDTRVGLKMGVMLKLVNESDGGFAADAGLTVVGEMEEQDGLQSWSYKYVHLSEANIDISTGSVSIQGSLANFEEDNIYGDGFEGSVSLEVIGTFHASASAIFGKVDGLRYWYADALVELSAGVTIGALEFNSFGGGAYYHMRQLKSGESHNSQYGQTPTGVVYKPDSQTKFGVKARVGFRTAQTEKAFNGDATLEISFNNSGGIRHLQFRGNGYFINPNAGNGVAKIQDKFQSVCAGEDDMAGLEKGGSRGQLSAHVLLDYDVPAKTLHGNLSVYVNVAGNLLTGVGNGGLAGEAVIHFAPDKWYIHVGSPDQPIGLKALNIAEMTSYFMLGHDLPDAPEPPSNVSEIIGDIDLSYMDDENQLKAARGIAFGSAFTMNTGDLNFLMFYARFAAGLGYDIMLKDYGNVQCAGRSGPLGINGWYANGQAYAYFEGAIGIKVKVFGKKRKKKILDIGAAAVLQAKLPNPTWMKGAVGGYYSILGGMVKGRCKFEVTIGEECEMIGETSAVEGLNVISELTPANGKEEINVFNTPQAVFNMPVGEVFELVDVNDEKQTFMIKLDRFELLQGDAPINVKEEWNAEKNVVSIKPHELLPGVSELTAKVEISFLEKKNGLWEPVTVDGNKVTEEMETSFTTGERPDYIPRENVLYSYPVDRMYNFYKNEHNKGYVQLDYGQNYLFVGEEGHGWMKKMRFITSDGRTFEKRYNYEGDARRITFNIPSELTKNEIYKLQFVKIPTSQQDAVDQNVRQVEQDQDLGKDSTTLTIQTQDAEGEIKAQKDKEIYYLHFRTSNYNSFTHKLNNIGVSEGWRWPVMEGVHELGVNIADMVNSELFDECEIHGTETMEPLIQCKAILSDNDYYQNTIQPLIYGPLNNQDLLSIDHRNEQPLGMPPVYGFHFNLSTEGVQLSQAEINSGVFNGIGQSGSISYDLVYHYSRDYFDLEAEAAAKSSNGVTNAWIEKLVSGYFPIVEDGYYKFRIKYILPGEEEASSSKIIRINNNAN